MATRMKSWQVTCQHTNRAIGSDLHLFREKEGDGARDRERPKETVRIVTNELAILLPYSSPAVMNILMGVHMNNISNMK